VTNLSICNWCPEQWAANLFQVTKICNALVAADINDDEVDEELERFRLKRVKDVAKEEIEANAALVSSLFTFLLCGIPVPLAPCFVYVIKGNYPISLLLVTSKNADLSVFPG
jgi:hypothetical protein